MYADPSLVRTKYHKVSLNDYEQMLLDKLREHLGGQASAMVRRGFVKWAESELHALECAEPRQELRVAYQRLMAI